MEGQFDFAGFEWANGRGRNDVFSQDMSMAVTIAAGGLFRLGRYPIAAFGRFRVGLLLWFGLSASGGRAVDGQFRLVRIIFAFRCHAISIQDNKVKGLREQKHWMRDIERYHRLW